MVRWMRLLLLRATCFATGRMVVPRSSVVVLLLVIGVVVVVRDVLGGTHGPAFWCFALRRSNGRLSVAVTGGTKRDGSPSLTVTCQIFSKY
jgi:hypothetical protein